MLVGGVGIDEWCDFGVGGVLLVLVGVSGVGGWWLWLLVGGDGVGVWWQCCSWWCW